MSKVTDSNTKSDSSDTKILRAIVLILRVY